MSWTVRLSDTAPQKRLVVFLVAVTVLIFGVVVLRQPVLGLIGGVAILASTADFWLGVEYTLTDEEAKRRCGLSVSAIQLNVVKRVVIEGNHVKLSPLEETSRLSVFRGVMLVTTAENRERVLERLQTQLKDVRFLGN